MAESRALVGCLWLAVTLGAACGREPEPVAPRASPPYPDPTLASEAINAGDLPALRRIAGHVMQELIAALPDERRERVQRVTLVPDALPGEVNAYAMCNGGAPIVVISDDLLLVEAELASARATDELFETVQTQQYIEWMADRAGKPIRRPPHTQPSFLDRRKVGLQRELFSEQLAYVFGHELAHHYLGHLECTSASVLEDIARAATDLPAFNQLAEIAADVAGIKNVLAAGKRHTGYQWTEEGALVLFEFLTKYHELQISDVVFPFERTHPFPVIRLPIVMSTADLWRVSGGHLPPI